MRNKGAIFFPNLRRNDWNELLQQTRAVASHPMSELGCPPMRIHATFFQYLSLRRCLDPVVHDVLLRLFFGDLIVGLRLYFLKTLNPTIQQCVRESCVAIETLEHCFFSCPGLQELWQSLWVPWSKIFTVDLSWRLLLFPQSRDENADRKQHYKLLLLLWRVHTAIVFHAIWRLRNKIHFKETETEKLSIQSFFREWVLIFPNQETYPNQVTEYGLPGLNEYERVLGKFTKKSLLKQLVFHDEIDTASKNARRTKEELVKRVTTEASLDGSFTHRRGSNKPSQSLKEERDQRYIELFDSKEVTAAMSDPQNQTEVLAIITRKGRRDEALMEASNDQVVSVMKEKLWASSSRGIRVEITNLPDW
ncbi:hypothetical protein P3T76_004788 [Phytophthora citrophthora]|uniref:Uncharacterized protein n=1 Tax=Phytophthora citrophthora TaxID=4793 RepID=A0AAD9GRI3_9STRA|nr:hypothetical protein P3T76_004788 [Phytophthora citrophthora]